MDSQRQDSRGTPKGKGVIVGANGGGLIGNPPFVPTDQQRADVRSWIKVTSADVIAAKIGISRDTLDRHFKAELADGRFDAVAAVGGKLLAKALTGDIAAQIFYLKTQGKWTQRVEVTGDQGGPIKVVDVSRAIENYSEEQLALIEPLLEQLLAAGGADFDFRDQLGATADQGEAG